MIQTLQQQLLAELNKTTQSLTPFYTLALFIKLHDPTT